ncbi:MAG: tripartite tricarboxylate transporter TctB family protein [bacterium]|nr:tripartite tricarboxylate transporter TctB family protein [Gammaproteobacteria bacterium]HIL95228.1 tripartite tricarboxylate transporter TctB family protein [Pseudomonadales bacterium]
MFVYISNIRLVGLIFLVLSCAYIYFAGEIPLDFWSEEEVFNARTMPYMIGTCSILCSALLIAMPSTHFNWNALRGLNWFPAGLLLVMLSLYGLLLEDLGFVIATTLLLLISFAMLGERKITRMVSISLGLALGFWLLMDQLGIYLAPGLLESIFGELTFA